MSSERWIVIPGWDDFQHRDAARANVPTWIKDFTQQLSKEEYLALTWEQRGLLHDLRLEYARAKRQLSASTTSLSRRLGRTVRSTQLAALNQAGFIEFSASNPAGNPASNPAGSEKKREEQPTTEAHYQETAAQPDQPQTDQQHRDRLRTIYQAQIDAGYRVGDAKRKLAQLESAPDA